MMLGMSKWSVYILKCGDGSLYTGITTDLARRLATHRAGLGAKYTRSRLPVEVVYRRSMRNESVARRRELEIKSLKRVEKLRLIGN